MNERLHHLKNECTVCVATYTEMNEAILKRLNNNINRSNVPKRQRK